ncbi:MAG: hypothetical protein IBX61_07440 [Thermoleophilia bacterium]|nr:hypothetical protein [Thermoleophilia bacterium]
MVEDTMERFIDVANVDRVYGEPIAKDDTLIIPAAEVMGGLGLGAGFGMGAVKEKQEERQADEGGGGGGGGGGRVQSRPVAVVVAANGDVRVEPIIDKTRIVLTAIVANGILFLFLARMFRRRKSLFR